MDVLVTGALSGFIGFAFGLYFGSRSLEDVHNDLDKAKEELKKVKAKIDAKKKN